MSDAFMDYIAKVMVELQRENAMLKKQIQETEGAAAICSANDAGDN